MTLIAADAGFVAIAHFLSFAFNLLLPGNFPIAFLAFVAVLFKYLEVHSIQEAVKVEGFIMETSFRSSLYS